MATCNGESGSSLTWVSLLGSFSFLWSLYLFLIFWLVIRIKIFHASLFAFIWILDTSPCVCVYYGVWTSRLWSCLMLSLRNIKRGFLKRVVAVVQRGGMIPSLKLSNILPCHGMCSFFLSRPNMFIKYYCHELLGLHFISGFNRERGTSQHVLFFLRCLLHTHTRFIEELRNNIAVTRWMLLLLLQLLSYPYPQNIGGKCANCRVCAPPLYVDTTRV